MTKNTRLALRQSLGSLKQRAVRMLVGAVAGLMLTAGLSAPASAAVITQNLLVNGGFEEMDFTGWTLADSSAFTSVQCFGVPPPTVAEGFCAAYLSTATEAGTLSQDFTTILGGRYFLSFQYLVDSEPADLIASVNGAPVFFSLNAPAGSDFTTATAAFFATGTTSTLSFAFRNDFGATSLDDVLVAQVPEPASLALLSLGILALAMTRRRRSA